MPVYETRSPMPVSRDALYAYHANPGALERLIPPWQAVKIHKNAGPLADGKIVDMALKIGPIWKRWTAEHFDVVANERFRDRALRGPFQAWTHSHLFEGDATQSAITDHVEYELPLGRIGSIGGGFVRSELQRMFRFRHARTLHDVTRHAGFADRPRLRVAISGATGAVAANLMPFLTTGGHAVRKLVRGRLAADNEIAWNADSGDVDRSLLSECDALVHLAGQNIAVRWTTKRKEEIRKSRVDATRKLCETLAAMPRRPGVMICASAVGFYGNRGEEILDESKPHGEGFVAETCAAWEAATQPARDAGIRVVNLRIGVVLSANSGALPKMLTPAKLGLAGRLGSGEQWMPWIAMEDLVGAIHRSLFDETLAGPVNAVTQSVRQHDFIATLGRVLHRPTILPMPSSVIKTLFGQMGEELLLASANVQPAQLAENGFEPALTSLEAAFRFELGR